MTSTAEEEAAIFVSRATAAARLEISVDTFNSWVSDGFLPGAAIVRGQILRWYWPAIEKRHAGDREPFENPDDAYLRGVGRHAKGKASAAA